MRIWLFLGAVSALIAVAVGAAATHALAGDARAAQLAEIAARYQIYHALALVAVALLVGWWPGLLVHAAGLAFAVGTLLFSGSLYATAFAAAPSTALTPAGGLCFMLGWLLLALSALRRRPLRL